MDFDETLIDPAPGPVRALIFDFDGLILDTEMPIFTSWRELYEANGGSLAFSDWLTVVGTVSNELEHFDWLENQIGRTLDHASLSVQRRRRQAELIEAQPVLPGIIDTLNCARELKMKIGLASSSPRTMMPSSSTSPSTWRSRRRARRWCSRRTRTLPDRRHDASNRVMGHLPHDPVFVFSPT